MNVEDPTGCILPVTYTPTCQSAPEGTAYNPATNRCEHVDAVKQVEPNLVCSVGLLVDGICYSGDVSVPDCPIGSTYNADTDICERSLPTTSLYCLEGNLTNTGSSFVCRTSELKHPDCPATSKPGFYL